MTVDNRFKFTTARLDRFTCEPDKAAMFFWDTEIIGFGVKVYATGKKTFIYQGRVGKLTPRMTIGDAARWTLDRAKQEAKRLSVLCDQGIDPRQEKQDAIDAHEATRAQAKREGLTFGEVWVCYIEANKGRWRETTLFDHIRLARVGGESTPYTKTRIKIRQPIAALLPIRLTDLSAEYLAAWLQRENSTRPTSAALSFRLVRACLNWCEEQPEYSGLLPDKSIHARKVRQLVQPTQAKRDCLTREQLQPFFTELLKISNPVQSAYLQMTLLIGARREEVALLKWEDIDFKWKRIHLADKVEDYGRDIPLTPYIEQLLQQLPRVNQWIFSSESKSGHIVEPTKQLKGAAMRSGIPDITIHGLRRSFKTLAEWVDIPSGVASQIAGHKASGVSEKHYIVRPLDMLQQHHERLEAWILKEAGFIQNSEQQYRHSGGLKVVA